MTHAVVRFATRLLLAALLGCLGACASLPPQAQRTPSHALPASGATVLGRIAADSSPAPELTGFRLLPIGAFALNTRIALAQRAQATLDVQYYHIANDQTGRYFLRSLRDAALRGVRVRLLVDDLYTAGSDPLLLGLAAHPNVEVRLFNPFPAGRDGLVTRFIASLADFRRVNHRMHNKLFIADGAMAVAGGRNVADEYFMRNLSANFVDLDAFITGALVPRLAALFDGYWNSDVVFPLHAIVPPTLPAELQRAEFEAFTGPEHTPPPEAPPDNDVLGYGPISGELDDGRLGLIWAPANAYADSPDKIRGMAASYGLAPLQDVDGARYNVLDQMRRAQKEIVMTSPYLVPGASGMALMREVRERGVSLRVLTNSLAATDEPVVHTGYKRYRPQMLRLGVELYELSPTRVKRNLRLGMFGSSHGRLHAKTAVIDRSTVFIGSMNFDPRSDKHNTEMAVLVQSPQLAREVLRLMDLDKLQASYRVRLRADGSDGLEWLSTTDDEGELVLREEPDTSVWTRLLLQLLSPLAPEELL
ncbi:phospholipase D family protein [Ideonella sp. BN130291]|uniref:phospholipase D family protein n=1 Tax=Ideonella sp. BN130291 TaxID=3112940 RepID=UPI002E254F8E|nr:phospholipase D family protein [Ideonella sp. BN130291]